MLHDKFKHLYTYNLNIPIYVNHTLVLDFCTKASEINIRPLDRMGGFLSRYYYNEFCLFISDISGSRF